MFIDRWMTKEAVVQSYNRVLAIKKEQICISCSEVDECRASYTEWNKSEGEKQLLYINAYIYAI